MRNDPRWPLLLTLAFIVGVVVLPIASWSWRPLMGAALVLTYVVGVSGVEPGVLTRRWLGFAPLVGFLAAMVAMSHPSRAALGFWQVFGEILAKNSLAFTALVTLLEVCSFPGVISAFRRLGMPMVLVSTLSLMERYIHVLTDELRRMLQARRARSFRRWSLLDWSMPASLVAMLFLRTLERSDRIYSAMLARGWDGNTRTLDD